MVSLGEGLWCVKFVVLWCCCLVKLVRIIFLCLASNLGQPLASSFPWLRSQGKSRAVPYRLLNSLSTVPLFGRPCQSVQKLALLLALRKTIADVQRLETRSSLKGPPTCSV
ncbi:hypothetical protein QBC36DRAFT_76721 [Triangularia setosa]|uniref:Uncharacterized protein n=1 Tax=Triangularia setosa TaxID=2587417 RepID=A0AAN6VYX8_9PEZI|nr:hypothetical protein QBC36DRAFT_76721 [Podospora setosa]